MPIRDILILTFLLGSLPACFFSPFYGVLVWTVVSFLNPQRFTWGPAQDFPVALAVAIPTLAGFVLFNRDWKRLACREVVLLFLLWVWFTLTTIASTQTPLFAHHAAETWYRWKFVSKILLMTVMTIGVTDSWSRFRWLLLTIAGSFGLLVLKTLPFMIRSGGEFRIYGPPDSMLADNNDFALALNMALPFFFYLAKTESNRLVKRLFGFIFVAAIPAIFLTYSRGGIVGLAAVFVLLLLRGRQKVALFLVLACAVILAVVVLPEQWQQRMQSTTDTSRDVSIQGRFNAWNFAWNLAHEYPITGGGFDTFTPELFNQFAPDPLGVHVAHSIYLGVLAEHGFTGLALYLIVVFSCFWKLWLLRTAARQLGNERIVSYANMLRISLVAFLVSGAFLSRQYFDFFFSIVACIAVLKMLTHLEVIERIQPIPQGWMPETSMEFAHRSSR